MDPPRVEIGPPRVEIGPPRAEMTPRVEPPVQTLVAEQRALLDLAALSVRHVRLQENLRLSKRTACARLKRQQSLRETAEQLLTDLTRATSHIRTLEEQARLTPLLTPRPPNPPPYTPLLTPPS